MSRPQSFSGGNPFARGRHKAPYTINDRRVTLAAYRRRFGLAFGDDREGKRPIERRGSVKGRKLAICGRKKLIGCDHEFEYHEEHEDYGCYGTNTYRWLECSHCHDQRSANWNDAPTYEDYE